MVTNTKDNPNIGIATRATGYDRAMEIAREINGITGRKEIGYRQYICSTLARRNGEDCVILTRNNKIVKVSTFLKSLRRTKDIDKTVASVKAIGAHKGFAYNTYGKPPTIRK